jgi:hypothetical protein
MQENLKNCRILQWYFISRGGIIVGISESKIKRYWKNYYLFLIVVHIVIFSLTMNFIYMGLDSRERYIEYIEYIVALDLYKLTWDEINLEKFVKIY